MARDVVIVGGGLAGQRCAEALRRGGHDGPVRIVCAEALAPYDRPPLSKELLAGGRKAEALRFRDDAWYGAQEVELVLGRPATGLDPSARRLTLGDGTTLRYGSLVVATGAAARPFAPLAGFDNVLRLRDLGDAVALGGRLGPGVRLLIVGGGFVGLEVASTARALGAEVTVVEAAAAPLSGPLGEAAGAWFAALHRRRGVAVEVGARIVRVHGDRSVRCVELADGRRLGADVVLVAVGAVPDTAWLAAADLPPDGVPVGPGGVTALPGVLAVGDAARPRDPRTGRLARREHWEAAARSGAAAARTLLGAAPGAEPPASFWSDQHGIRVHLVGEPAGSQRTTLHGRPGDADFSITYWRDGLPAAVLLVGRPAALPAARRLVAGAEPEPEPERHAA